MRGTVARRIRQKVYGDFSHRERKYKFEPFEKLRELFKEKKRDRVPGTFYAVGLRREYQQAKKAYYAGGLSNEGIVRHFRDMDGVANGKK